MSALQRFTDWRRERRINRLRVRACHLFDLRLVDDARAVMRELTAEVNARSPQQVARMERAMGLARSVE